jgi:hypothetical protein
MDAHLGLPIIFSSGLFELNQMNAEETPSASRAHIYGGCSDKERNFAWKREHRRQRGYPSLGFCC